MSDARENLQRCPAIKKNGDPCTARATGDGFCIGHSPNALEARRKGGAATSKLNRAKMLMPARLKPVSERLERALEEVHTGELEPRKATAMASVAGALVKVVTSGELEERVRMLESRVKKSEQP